MLLILGIAGSFAIELCARAARPHRRAERPVPVRPRSSRNPDMLYIAVGILGATVMPHNLYLHSSIIQTRKYGDSTESRRQAVRFATIDSTVALMFGAVPQRRDPRHGGRDVPRQRATRTSPTSRTRTCCSRRCSARSSPARSSPLALLFSGQNATLTGTLAGQIVMEGFLNIRLRPWLRRLITRLIAIVPALITVALYGERGSGALLILSQVILSLQLPFAVFPLVLFTGDRRKMGDLVAPRWMVALAWPVAVIDRGAQRLAAVADLLREDDACTATSSSPSNTRTPTAPCSTTSSSWPR